MVDRTCRCKKSQNRFLAKYGWNDRYTNIQVHTFNIDTEMSILWNSPFCNIKIAEDLDTRNQGIMDIFLQRHEVANNTIHTHSHACMVLKWLDMDIGCIGVISTDKQAVKQVDDWRIIVALFYADLHNLTRLCCIRRCFLCCLSCRYL